MMPRWAKAAFYLICGPAMNVSACLYRRFRAPSHGPVRVHLGPGQDKYLPGWINIDANIFTGKCDVWADLRNPLPLRDATVEAIYSHHVIEHLPSVEQHLRDVYRCLVPGGTYRVGGPNGDSAIRKFVQNDHAWFPDFPVKRTSIGGRFENFVFCQGEHLTILTESFLKELMERIGFINVTRCLPVTETNHHEKFGPCLETEWETDYESPHTLLLEAEKPRET